MVGNYNRKNKNAGRERLVIDNNLKREKKGQKKTWSLNKLIQRTLHRNFFITSWIFLHVPAVC